MSLRISLKPYNFALFCAMKVVLFFIILQSYSVRTVYCIFKMSIFERFMQNLCRQIRKLISYSLLWLRIYGYKS